MEERLRKFAVLIDAGSFTKASATLHISQPALSTAIAKLERELKAQLIVRSPRSFRMTEAGQIAYSAAKELNVHRDNLVKAMSELAGKPVPIAMGMIDSVATALFQSNDTISSLEQSARVSIVVNNSRYLRRAVEKDELDIAFVTVQESTINHLTVTSFVATEPLILICRPNRVIETESELKDGRLKQFISYDPASNSHGLIKTQLEALGLRTDTTFSSTSPDVMLRMVLLGKGAAVLPHLLVHEHIAAGELTMPRLAGSHVVVKRPIHSVTRRGKTLTPALEQVLEDVKHLLGEQNQTLKKQLTYR